MWNNPSGGKHLCERANLSVSQNWLTTSPNKPYLPMPTQKADTTTPSPSASPASCSKSISTAPTATNKWLLATDQVRQALQLTRVPDHTTLYRTFAKLSQQQWQQQGRRAAAAPSSERNDRRCGHHRLSQRHGKCVLSEPSWGHAAFVGAGLWWVLRASGLWGCGWGADLVQTRSGSPRCGRRRVGMGYARGVWHDCGCWRTQGLMVGM
jgi:hypothetical protein